jgi:hypothetical protein
MREIWNKIPGYLFYEVSNYGNIRSWVGRGQYGKKLVIPKKKKTFIGSDGYIFVKLQQGGKRTCYRVHRLVLEAFVGNRPNGLGARHLDGIKAHNYLYNLEWATSLVNNRDKVRHGTNNINERHGLCNVKNWIVILIKKLLHENNYSQVTIAKICKVSPQYVSKIKFGYVRSTINIRGEH